MSTPQPATGRGLLDQPDLVALGIGPLLDAFRRRWIAIRLVECALFALATGLAAFLVVAWLLPTVHPVPVSVAIGLAVMAMAALAIGMRAPDSTAMAPAADRVLGLKTSISSTVELYRHGSADTPVAQALRALTGHAIATSPGSREPYLTMRAKSLLAVLAALLAALALTLMWPWQSTTQPLSAQDIAQLSDLFQAEAARTADEALAEIAADLDDLAERAPEQREDLGFAADLRDTLERAANRFGGNRNHDFPPFDGASPGLMHRVNEFLAEGGALATSPASVPAGKGVDTPAEELASDDIRAMDVGGGDDNGVSLGIEPQEGQGSEGLIADDENASDLDRPLPQMEGQAEGAGTGQTDMAGTGEADGAVTPLDALPTPGFAETQEITANQRESGATTRVGMEVDATSSPNGPATASRDWPPLEPVPVERFNVPPGARDAVAAYFARNLEAEP